MKCSCCGADFNKCYCHQAGPCSCKGGKRKLATWNRCMIHCMACNVNDLDRMFHEREHHKKKLRIARANGRKRMQELREKVSDSQRMAEE